MHQAPKGGSEAIGKSRGGASTKLHATVDGHGNPVRLKLTEGQVHDVTQAIAMLQDEGVQVLADKAYDSDTLREHLDKLGCESVIPSKKNRLEARPIDTHTYKSRHLVENFFAKLKHFRRVATRYEKTARNYLAMVHVASIIILLR